MTKVLWGLVVPCALGLAVFAATAGLLSRPYIIAHASVTQPSLTDKPPPVAVEKWAAVRSAEAAERSVRWAALAALISGAGLLGVGLAWRAAVQSNVIARESAAAQLRAYVAVDTATLHGPVIGHELRSEISVINVGQTPARDVDLIARLHVGPPSTSRQTLSVRDDPRSPVFSDVGPGRLRLSHPSMQTPWTAAEDAALKTGHLVIFLYGEVRYSDIFGVSRVTRFRYKHTAGSPPFKFLDCANGNEST